MSVIAVRQALCRGRCEVDASDPCAVCPNGHWSQYEAIRCEEANKSSGLGDKVASVAQPIANALDFVLGTKIASCGGCAKRRAKLNKLGEKLGL